MERFFFAKTLISLLVSTLHVEDEPKKEYTIKWKIVFVLDNNNLKEWGSEGQRKNAIISFKLAEINVINEIKGYYPILILDDLFSELDKEKVTNLLGMLDRNVQTFMTTTDLKNISKKVIKDAKKFKVNDGILEEE